MDFTYLLFSFLLQKEVLVLEVLYFIPWTPALYNKNLCLLKVTGYLQMISFVKILIFDFLYFPLRGGHFKKL